MHKDRQTDNVQRSHLSENLSPPVNNETAFISANSPKMMNDWSISQMKLKIESKLWKTKANKKTHYLVSLGVHSRHCIIVWLLAALFFSQQGLKALENQMFKLAGEGVYNNVPSHKHCTLQKVLWEEAECRRPADKLGVFLKNVFEAHRNSKQKRANFRLLNVTKAFIETS